MNINDELRKMEELYDSRLLVNLAKDDETKYNISTKQLMLTIRPRLTEILGQGYYEVIDEGEYRNGGIEYSVNYEVPNTDYDVELNVGLYEGGIHVIGTIYKYGFKSAGVKKLVKVVVPSSCELDIISWHYPITKVMDEIVNRLESDTKNIDTSSILDDSCSKFESFANEMIENNIKD